MGAIQTKVFKSGNSAAVRLPAELDVPIGTEVTLERVGTQIVLKPVIDPEEHRRRMRALVEKMEAIWAEAPYHEIEERAPIEFPGTTRPVMDTLIDTNIAIHFRDGNRAIMQRLAVRDQKSGISILSLAELEGGVYREPALAPFRRRLLDTMLEDFDLVELSPAIVSAYGRIVRDLGFSRRRIIDRLIAATALVHDLTLITMNEADFRDIPNLRLEVWDGQ